MKTHSVLLKSTAVTVAALIAFGGCNNSAKPAETSYDTQMPETSAAAPGTAVQTTAPEQAADNTDTDEISGSAVTSPALETSDVSEPTEAQEPEEETSVAGTYVYIATSGYLSKKEVTEEHILATVENALEYYKEKGKYKGIVINEDGSGVAHLEQNSKNVLLEDGRYYDYRGGCAFELDGNILSVGLPDSSTYWSIYYKLSDEQIAGLPEPAGEFMENNYIIKIPTDSRNQQNVLLNAINTLFDAGEDPNDHLDELTELVKETAKEEKQKLDERRAHAEYTADLSFYDKQLSITDINRLNDGNVQICTDKNGNVSFICGTCTDSPIENEQDAYNAIEAVMTLIGGDEDTKFEFLNMFTDIYGFSYYTFLDYDKYGAVDDRIIAKVMVNKDNKMVALSAAFLPEDNIIDDSTLSEEGEPLPLTADDLSEIVYKNCGYDRSLITVYDELTETKLISRTKEITSDDYFNTEDPCWHQKVWIVYTNAPGNEKYPYLAHYITFSGRYLHNIPVSEPADEAALFGYDTVYTFDGMTAEEWTGQVVYPDGREETVTVPVMKDNETGKYYLADPGRRIACADFYEYIYNDCNLEMKSSDTNDDWDNDNLVAYSNLIKSWDYYDSHGWTSPNGTDSPTLLLVDACKRDGTLYDNAFYCDNCFGWYMFAIGYPTYGMALDSIAHEYTHAFTGTSMNITFYKNDSGAIDEAISDILGNIIEEVYTGKNDPDWNIGEDSGTTLRCASDPHKFCYPEHVWDKFYVMNVADPFVLVDNGGVHVNSNILYRIAYKLVKEGSMTYEEATQLWMTADYMRTYVTDFKQLSVILPYLTDAIGMSRYTPLIEQYIDEARLSEKCMPEKLDENTAFVTLTLPDTEEFSDNQWCLYVFTEGPYEGYSSDYRFNEDNSEHDEGDSRNTFFMGGESYDGRISLIAEPGFSQVVLYHIDPETGEVDRMFNYGDDKWAEIENVAYGTYQLLEGYNVLSQEGLTAGDNG